MTNKNGRRVWDPWKAGHLSSVMRWTLKHSEWYASVGMSCVPGTSETLNECCWEKLHELPQHFHFRTELAFMILPPKRCLHVKTPVSNQESCPAAGHHKELPTVVAPKESWEGLVGQSAKRSHCSAGLVPACQLGTARPARPHLHYFLPLSFSFSLLRPFPSPSFQIKWPFFHKTSPVSVSLWYGVKPSTCY